MENYQKEGQEKRNNTTAQRMATGVFRDRESTERAYNMLKERGYSQEEINLIMSDETRKTYFKDAEGNETEIGTKAAEGAGKGSAIGGTIGAIAGVIAALGTSLVIPGLGIIIAGPIAAGLAGAGAGGLAGGLIGALVGAGIPEARARLYESGIKEGDILIAVRPHSDEDERYFESNWETYNESNEFRESDLMADDRNVTRMDNQPIAGDNDADFRSGETITGNRDRNMSGVDTISDENEPYIATDVRSMGDRDMTSDDEMGLGRDADLSYGNESNRRDLTSDDEMLMADNDADTLRENDEDYLTDDENAAESRNMRAGSNLGENEEEYLTNEDDLIYDDEDLNDDDDEINLKDPDETIRNKEGIRGRKPGPRDVDQNYREYI